MLKKKVASEGFCFKDARGPCVFEQTRGVDNGDVLCPPPPPPTRAIAALFTLLFPSRRTPHASLFPRNQPIMPPKDAPPTPDKSKSPSKKRKSRGVAPGSKEVLSAPIDCSSPAKGQLPASLIANHNSSAFEALNDSNTQAPIVEGPSSGTSPTTPPPSTIEVSSLGQCSPLSNPPMGRISCHVVLTTNSAIDPLVSLTSAAAIDSNARELRFVAVDVDGTMAGFRLEYPTASDAEAAKRVATKGQTIHVTNVRSQVVREPNQKTVMPRSFHSSLAHPARISVAAQALTPPSHDLVLTGNANGFAFDFSSTNNGFMSMLCLVTAAARPHVENGHRSRCVTVMTTQGATVALSLMKRHAKLDLAQRPKNKRPVLWIEGAMMDASLGVIAMDSSIVTCNDPEFWPKAPRDALFSLLDTHAEMDIQVATSDIDIIRDPAKVMRRQTAPPPPPPTPTHPSSCNCVFFAMQRRPWVGSSIAASLRR